MVYENEKLNLHLVCTFFLILSNFVPEFHRRYHEEATKRIKSPTRKMKGKDLGIGEFGDFKVKEWKKDVSR